MKKADIQNESIQIYQNLIVHIDANITSNMHDLYLGIQRNQSISDRGLCQTELVFTHIFHQKIQVG